ncbi:MAG: hypothetical protein M1821_004514 [Bathelium mastoideum]|nr:MAG: hypothetical protein M1821_004514 [Bathelium mastoideum]
MEQHHQRRLEDYTVGWVCALPIELEAARAMLDEEHNTPQVLDGNVYTFGRIHGHNVVIGCLPSGQYGTNSAAVVATRMARTFRSLRSRFMVGIGGGVPSAEADVRLGDVVVSEPKNDLPGVVQYDMGKRLPNGQYKRTGFLPPPPDEVLQATAKLKSSRDRKPLSSLLPQSFNRPDSQDVLFEGSYEHIGGSTCQNCLQSRVVPRSPRSDGEPRVHYGIIASGNQVMKDGIERDKLTDQVGEVLCFEMEAAGLMSIFPSLVIRGICDYADSHKNKEWQPHAAGVAAAYVKELLVVIPPPAEEISQTVTNVTTVDSDSWQPTKEDQNRCLKSLWFSEMAMREHAIDSETPGTCVWLDGHENFKAWLRQRQGLLWIQGNPGAGKSTLMRHALYAQRQHESSKNMIVLGFFFHARAGSTSIQNSVLGFYRSLLHQLLSKAPTLLTDFMTKFKNILQSTNGSTLDWAPYQNELRNFLRDSMPRYSESKSIQIFVDALDESGEKISRELVQYFDRLVKDTTQQNGSLAICFSYRHFPIINPKDCLTICVENENRQDLATHIQDRLENRPEALRLKEKILEKAQGLFQWVDLVVQMIAEMDDEGDYGQMETRLKGIPEGLGPLYDTILDKLVSKEPQRATRLLRWICFAFRPLKMSEMRWAIMIDGDCQFSSLKQLAQHRLFAKTDEQLRKQIRTLSGGLAEVAEERETEDQSGIIQFIHLSVQDYLCKSGLRRLGCEASEGEHHFQLSRACVQYLKMPEIRRLEPVNIDETRRLTAEKAGMFSFIEYAVGDWTRHALTADSNGILLGRFFDLLPWPSCDFADTTARLGESFRAQYLDLYRRDAYDGKPAHATILHQAAFYSLPSWVQAICDSVPYAVQSEDNRGRTALSWACLSEPSLWIGRDGTYHPNMAQNITKTINILLKQQGTNPNSRDQDGRTPLAIAAADGNPLAMKLLSRRQVVDVNCKDRFGCTPLISTVRLWGTKIVQEDLCEQCDVHGRVRLLLKRSDIDINTGDFEGRTALSWAVGLSARRLVQRLLSQSDIVTDQKDNQGRSPLSWAAEGDETKDPLKILQMLLERGDVDPDSKDKDGRTPLSYASGSHLCERSWTDSPVVEILLDRRDVNPDSRDINGRSPLSWAAEKGSAHAIQKFIDRVDVDLGSYDNKGRTPRWYLQDFLDREMDSSLGFSYSEPATHDNDPDVSDDGDPDVSDDDPDVNDDDPDVSDDDPDVSDDDLMDIWDELDVSDDDPDVGDNNPDVRDDDPNVGDNANVDNDNPDVNNDNPDVSYGELNYGELNYGELNYGELNYSDDDLDVGDDYPDLSDDGLDDLLSAFDWKQLLMSSSENRKRVMELLKELFKDAQIISDFLQEDRRMMIIFIKRSKRMMILKKRQKRMRILVKKQRRKTILDEKQRMKILEEKQRRMEILEQLLVLLP